MKKAISEKVKLRLQRGVGTSIDQLQRITSNFIVSGEVDLQALRAAAYQATQVASGLNQLIGIYDLEMHDK